MTLRNKAAEYFGSMNSIASRIHADLQETKGAYEDLWDKLSREEQDQILTESIIKPEVSIRYGPPRAKGGGEYAVKIVVDDHCSYRDEHSGPFSFRTRSQRNLTVFQGDPPKDGSDKAITIIAKPRLKTIPKHPKVPLYAQDLDLKDISCNPRQEDELSSNSNTLPKTGLDFLDNW